MPYSTDKDPEVQARKDAGRSFYAVENITDMHWNG